jgi:CPA2 family monovalent cation:H+ antiporter-2
MPHSMPIVSTIVLGLVLAFTLGVFVHRFKLPPLLGYLLAGIAIGPFTPGFVADQDIANQLAEIGVILLMFGVGLHFSLADLLSVRAIAISGALTQAAVAVPLGMAIGWLMGWPLGAGIIFGIALSVASTVVTLRLLQERRLVETERGRIAVGWLIVQDILMVFVLVLLPSVAGLFGADRSYDSVALLEVLTITFGKIGIFIAFMLLVGTKVVPAILHYVAHTGSRELFRLAVLSIALGVAFASAELFGVSIALGAFFAGMILSESRLSQQAATESLPFRDAFAVLFFVSVGMLFDPEIVVSAPLALLATVLVILFLKSFAAYAVIRLFRHGVVPSLTIATLLAQIGEFSFILAGKGVALDLLPEEGRDLILAGAIISILLNPALFALLENYIQRRERARGEAPPLGEVEAEAPTREPIRPTALTGHVVIVGYGRVGRFMTEALRKRHVPLFIIEDDDDAVEALRDRGIEALSGNAADPEVIPAANLGAARCILVAIPNAFEGGQVVQQARALNPTLPIIARAHSDAEIEHLKRLGATTVVMGEHEIAKAMIHDVNAAMAVTPIAEEEILSIDSELSPAGEFRPS